MLIGYDLSVLMSKRRLTMTIGYLGATLGLIVLVACGGPGSPKRLPAGYRLVQKDQFQALYGPDGRIVRLLYDRNHDDRAEAVIVYSPNGKAARGEFDTDEDGSVDRWEYFRTDGTLDHVDVDANRDGKVDRTEYPQ
jgi:hypothetical protein